MHSTPELGLVALAFLVFGLAIGFGWCDRIWREHNAQKEGTDAG